MLRIIQGEDKTFAITFRKANGDPYDLTGVTQIKLCFPGETAQQTLLLTASEISVVNAVLGKCTATINDTKSAALKIGDKLSFEAEIDKGSARGKVQFIEQLQVKESLC